MKRQLLAFILVPFLLLLGTNSSADAAATRMYGCLAPEITIDIAELDPNDSRYHYIELGGAHAGLASLAAQLDLGDAKKFRFEFERTNFTKCTFKRIDGPSDPAAVFDCFFRGTDGKLLSGSKSMVVRNVSAVSRFLRITTNGPDSEEFDLTLNGQYLVDGHPQEFRVKIDRLAVCEANYQPF